MTDSYKLLISKLDKFTRKYYTNQIIRGGLYSIGLILILFLTINLLEYNFYFHSGVRKVLFYSFIGISGIAVYFWVVVPLMHFFSLGKVISHQRAAQIIGEHFTEVKDKLLNVLQLKDQSENAGNIDLLLASINQKSEEIKLVPFRKAIDLSKNKKYLRYTLIPLLALFAILFAAPSLIKESSFRLLKNNIEFEKPAPFHFIIEGDDFTAVQYDDFPIEVKIEGEVLPNEIFIAVDDYQYRMKKIDVDKFAYRFVNLQKDVKFQLFSSDVFSKKYKLKVLKKPNILRFDVNLDYPAYTGRKDEKLANIGDLVVPIGTKINWSFAADNTDKINLKYSADAEIKEAKPFAKGEFSYSKKVMKDENYKLYLSNKDLPFADSIGYSLSVIPDMYPSISVESFRDSTIKKLMFFVGEASDDYGLLNLSFNYKIKHEDGSATVLNTLKIDKPSSKQIQYNYTFDFSDLELKPGDEVSYYFEVFDNDAINGSKSARTNLMIFSMPTLEEMEKEQDLNEEKIKKDLKKALDETKKLKKDFKKMQEKVLQKKELDWQDRKELEKMLERQKELEKEIEEAKQKFDENLKNQEEISKTEKNILEKQEKLQEMFEEVLSEEMQELMQQIEELLQELEKESALEMMEDMEMSDEEMETELDRLLELFKQLELEKELTETIEKLEELAEKQEDLSEKTKNNEKPQEELQKEQEKIDDEFKEIEEKMEEMEKKNEELENKLEIGNHDEIMEDIENDLDESQEQLQKDQNNSASKAQKGAAKKMKKMASAMEMQMQAGQMEQMEEDMEALRQLLENLIGLSFDQEDLMGYFQKTKINTPKYVSLTAHQFKLKDDFKMIEDSLIALSKRVFQIESFVLEKVSEVKTNMKKSLVNLEERKKEQAADTQQRVMKNVNDLALMLNEVMEQMQQQMAGMMPGSQMCNNPGGSGSGGQIPKDKIGQGQQSLKQQLQKMKEGMENGMPGSSKDFAKAAAKQAALRNALREKQKKMEEQGKGSKELQDLIDEMNKVETDLVNKRLTNEMMKRQEDILTRLLEAEKAERKRELDQKRKAESAKEYERKMPPSLEEYIKQREAEVEMYNNVSPALKPFYKILVEQYFDSLK